MSARAEDDTLEADEAAPFLDTEELASAVGARTLAHDVANGLAGWEDRAFGDLTPADYSW